MADEYLIKPELDADPLGRGYSGMTDAEVVDSLMNNLDRQPPNGSISGSTLLRHVVQAEYDGLSAAKQNQVLALAGVESLDPWGVGAGIVVDIFGAGSNTVQALASYRDTLLISRAQELGLGRVREGDVSRARGL